MEQITDPPINPSYLSVEECMAYAYLKKIDPYLEGEMLAKVRLIIRDEIKQALKEVLHGKMETGTTAL